MPNVAHRLFAGLVCLLSPASLCAQLKVTVLSAKPDVAAFYGATTWDSLRGLPRLTTPLVNLTFVTESGFRPAQRDTVDQTLPASLRLTGLQAADFQEIADAVYDAFTAELTAQGVEILPYEPLWVHPAFRELAHQARRSGREQSVPRTYRVIADISGGRKTVTVVGYHRPWLETFMGDDYLLTTRLTRELNAALPLISFLVEFVEYPADRAATYDWREFLPPAKAIGTPRLRARPQIYLPAGTAAFLLPDGQSAALTLTTPIGSEQVFVADLRRTSTHARDAGSYEVSVDPAAYKQAVTDLLRAQVVMIARKLAAGSR
ncbi:MAG: hypothetical protein PHE83_13805 [Opitutaceae bacterium]|nr:hypothetical protein [Opitutaceae bacterium]